MKDSIKFMLKNWLAWDKKSILYFIVRIPALILQPILTAYIPKAMIDCIENGATVETLILIVALLSLLVTLVTWLSPFLQELLNGTKRIIRMRYATMAFNINLHLDYTDIESIAGRKCNKRAMDFYKSNQSAASDFISILNEFFICFFGVLTSLALIFKIDLLMILIVAFTCVGEFLLFKYLNQKEKDMKDLSNGIVLKFEYYYSLSRDLSYAKDIRLYGFSDFFIYSISKLIVELEKIISKYTGQSIKVSGTRAFLNLIRDLVAYVYLTYLVYSNKLSISDFIFYFGILIGFSSWLMNMISCYSNIERCCNDCQAFRTFIKMKSTKVNEREINFDEIQSIEFKNVCYKYSQAEENTIKNMSFKINKGEKIAIVGENGAGKTTAIKLLCGLYYPTSGEILINGLKSSDFSSDCYFDLFSVVFQDYFFLPMTIAENVCANLKYDQERLYQAFSQAGILDKINSLTQKENSLMIKDVYKEAVDFSGGEKQKLLLAKAIYKNAPILILDEPTAALDPIAENKLYLKYNEITNDKISFFISHRLSSTRFCDKILFVENGTIVECGTHEELMVLKGSYYRMYQIQSYYYKEMESKKNEINENDFLCV